MDRYSIERKARHHKLCSEANICPKCGEQMLDYWNNLGTLKEHRCSLCGFVEWRERYFSDSMPYTMC